MGSAVAFVRGVLAAVAGFAVGALCVLFEEPPARDDQAGGDWVG